MKAQQFRIRKKGASGCLRCGGLMVAEHSVEFTGRRCVICGDLVDPFILRHRHERADETVRRPTPQRELAAQHRSP
ncbi:MAG: hypothetical protein C4293_15045 [Nitrospiraceae bacterium]